MRMDDTNTNPETEESRFQDAILRDVEWMGWKPDRVTRTSDYFDRLHLLAVESVAHGLAYVCHQSREEMEASRAARSPSPWRDRPPEQSLREFECMRRGMVAEGAATLRLRMDHASANPNMRDLVAYRVKFVPHAATGDAWCIYPSYDFSHCVVDALEGVSHSFCTMEFETRRPTYYWLLEALGMPHPRPEVHEFSRLALVERDAVRG